MSKSRVGGAVKGAFYQNNDKMVRIIIKDKELELPMLDKEVTDNNTLGQGDCVGTVVGIRKLSNSYRHYATDLLYIKNDGYGGEDLYSVIVLKPYDIMIDYGFEPYEAGEIDD